MMKMKKLTLSTLTMTSILAVTAIMTPLLAISYVANTTANNTQLSAKEKFLTKTIAALSKPWPVVTSTYDTSDFPIFEYKLYEMGSMADRNLQLAYTDLNGKHVANYWQGYKNIAGIESTSASISESQSISGIKTIGYDYFSTYRALMGDGPYDAIGYPVFTEKTGAYNATFQSLLNSINGYKNTHLYDGKVPIANSVKLTNVYLKLLRALTNTTPYSLGDGALQISFKGSYDWTEAATQGIVDDKKESLLDLEKLLPLVYTVIDGTPLGAFGTTNETNATFSIGLNDYLFQALDWGDWIKDNLEAQAKTPAIQNAQKQSLFMKLIKDHKVNIDNWDEILLRVLSWVPPQTPAQEEAERISPKEEEFAKLDLSRFWEGKYLVNNLSIVDYLKTTITPIPANFDISNKNALTNWVVNQPKYTRLDLLGNLLKRSKTQISYVDDTNGPIKTTEIKLPNLVTTINAKINPVFGDFNIATATIRGISLTPENLGSETTTEAAKNVTFFPTIDSEVSKKKVSYSPSSSTFYSFVKK